MIENKCEFKVSQFTPNAAKKALMGTPVYRKTCWPEVCPVLAFNIVMSPP
jgi:hypothetical protein